MPRRLPPGESDTRYQMWVEWLARFQVQRPPRGLWSCRKVLDVFEMANDNRAQVLIGRTFELNPILFPNLQQDVLRDQLVLVIDEALEHVWANRIIDLVSGRRGGRPCTGGVDSVAAMQHQVVNFSNLCTYQML